MNVASGLAHMSMPYATAYCMSKRGLVAYSDALRLEYGGEIDVTTVYPGYIRTQIHASSQAAGFGLEGVVPVEDVADAARALTSAALGEPARDLATTRQGTLNYALARHVPRRLMDRVISARLRRLARRGHFGDSSMANEMVARLRA